MPPIKNAPSPSQQAVLEKARDIVADGVVTQREVMDLDGAIGGELISRQVAWAQATRPSPTELARYRDAMNGAEVRDLRGFEKTFGHLLDASGHSALATAIRYAGGDKPAPAPPPGVTTPEAIDWLQVKPAARPAPKLPPLVVPRELAGAKTAKDVEAWFSKEYGSLDAIKGQPEKLRQAYVDVNAFAVANSDRGYGGANGEAVVRAAQLNAELKRYYRP